MRIWVQLWQINFNSRLVFSTPSNIYDEGFCETLWHSCFSCKFWEISSSTFSYRIPGGCFCFSFRLLFWNEVKQKVYSVHNARPFKSEKSWKIGFYLCGTNVLQMLNHFLNQLKSFYTFRNRCNKRRKTDEECA